MTVRDLVEAAGEDLEGLQIKVSEEGSRNWIQGYRISKKARLYPIDVRIEEREKHPWAVESCSRGSGFNMPVPAGEVLTVYQDFWEYPIKVMCISPKNAPDEVLDLEVKSFLPRNLPTIHGKQLFSNYFSLEILAYVPKDGIKVINTPEEKAKDIDGQLSLDEFIEKEKI